MIVVIIDWIFTVSKIVRVIRQPRGNMLLIGFGGSGRQSLTRLAAHICTYDTFQIEVSKNYRKLEFREGQSAHLLCIKIHNIRQTQQAHHAPSVESP